MTVEKNQPSPDAIHKLHELVAKLIKQPNFIRPIETKKTTPEG